MKQLLILILLTVSCSSIREKKNVNLIDQLEILQKNEFTQINDTLTSIYNDKNYQIFVYISKPIENLNIKEHSLKLAGQIGPGRQHLNNGVFLFLSPEQRSGYIRVGTGMEWVLSDQLSDSIFKQLTPFFKNSNYSGGINKFIHLIDSCNNNVEWNSRYELPEVENSFRLNKSAIFNISGEITGIYENSFTVKVGENEYPVYLQKHFNEGEKLKMSIAKRDQVSFYCMNLEKKKLKLGFLGF